MLRCAGLIYGPDLHHLDHLGPLCVLLDIPLIVTEEKIAHIAGKYYPFLKVEWCDYLTVAQTTVTHFDVIFYSMPRDLFEEVFFFAQKFAQKKVHTIWCPHGNSDKGNSIPYMEALKKEEIALVYGKQMVEFLQRKHVFDQLKAHIVTGNYRYAFYLKHQEFFDAIAEREVYRFLQPNKKTLFYAPTWRDYEASTSFFDAIDSLIDTLPSHYQIIVKLHPNLALQEEFKVEQILETYQSKEDVVFLIDFPLIYPLLNKVDVYIGDFSSIGYDFLIFNRPMFFLNQKKFAPEDLGGYLFRCGIEIPPEKYGEIYSIIDHYYQYEVRDFSTLRKEVYRLAFGEKSLESVRKEIEQALSIFPDPELNF